LAAGQYVASILYCEVALYRREASLSFVDFFKEIIAPGSALVLSLAALAIAWSFSGAYERMEQTRLNFDAFEKRFEIYEAARVLIDCVKRHEDAEARAHGLRTLEIKIEQARFLLDRPVQDLLREIAIVCSCILTTRDRRGRLKQGSDDEKWLTFGKELSAYDAKLTELNDQLAPVFERAIALPQLVQSRGWLAN
jgi:hypothetical protein